MSTFRFFATIVIPLYLLDQITKWWCVFHFTERKYVGKSIKDGSDVYHWFDDKGRKAIEIIPDFLTFPRVHNTGVAWGFGNGTAWAPVVFLIVPIVALFVVRILWKKGIFKYKPALYSAPLIVAGVLGNLTDRLTQGFFLEHLKDESLWTRFSSGYVVDFIAVKIPFIGEGGKGYDFPVFNVADSCITIAASLLFISAFFEERNKKKEEEAKAAAEVSDKSAEE